MQFLIQELCDYIKYLDINENDILYVSLNSEFWITWTDFKNLEIAPYFFNIYKGNFGEWYGLDDFRVALSNNKWIDYYLCDTDEYHSGFAIHEIKEKPNNRWFSFNKISDINISDFIKS